MKFFRKRSTAVVLTAIAVLTSTLLSVNVKFGDLVRDVTDSFYTQTTDMEESGVYRSIGSHLNNLCSYADGLVTIADNYGLDIEDVDWDLDSLKYAQSYSDEDISYVYYCYSELCSSVDKLVDQLRRTELSERDSSGVEQYVSSISGARTAVETAAVAYNDSVRAFRREYDRFPTDLLADLAGVNMPEYFS